MGIVGREMMIRKPGESDDELRKRIRDRYAVKYLLWLLTMLGLQTAREIDAATEVIT